MDNVHIVSNYNSFEIEKYKIYTNDRNEITYSILVEITFKNDHIKNERYSVQINDWHLRMGEAEELYSGTLSECRKEIKRLIELYWDDVKFEEVVYEDEIDEYEV